MDNKIKLYHKLECDSYHDHYIVGITKPHIIIPSQPRHIHLHNPCGPALLTSNARNMCSWYLNHQQYKLTEEYCNDANMSDEDKFLFMLTYGNTLPENIDKIHPDHNPTLTMNIHQTLP